MTRSKPVPPLVFSHANRAVDQPIPKAGSTAIAFVEPVAHASACQRCDPDLFQPGD